MKLKVILLTAFAALFSLAVTAETITQTPNQSTTSQTTTTPATTTVPVTTTTPATTTQSTTTQSVASTTQAPADKKAQQQADLLGMLLVINTNEINAGKLAESTTNNADVKQFAQTIQADHSKNSDDVKALASKLGIEPASSKKSEELAKKGDEELEKLKSEKDFDKAYINDRIKGNKKVLALLIKITPKAKNPDVKQYLESTRETVKQHLQMAANLQKKINLSKN